MSTPAIRVEKIGKQYRLGRADPAGRTFREAVTAAVRAPLRRVRRLRGRAHEEMFWALRDVCFEVQPGEVVGIIGRNGAGKSTLLKILSRITEPTRGRVELRGRVGSLLEVGTGFHPELTGRENIYLNGAILGMTRSEIKAQFDAIVEFSEIAPFLETAVKHYSSGMYVRLAFAVAAHLQPEILLVDEVLAVGDIAFQKKCLGKMQDVSRGGRTVLFVSHNTNAIASLCPRVLLLHAGELTFDGPTEVGVPRYIADAAPDADLDWDLGAIPRERPHLREALALLRVSAHPAADTTFRLGEPLRFTIEFAANAHVDGATLALNFDDLHGTRLATLDTPLAKVGADPQPGQRCSVEVSTEQPPFLPGYYLLSASLYSGGIWHDYVRHFGTFEVSPLVHETQEYYVARPGGGLVRMKSSWRLVGETERRGAGARAGGGVAVP